MSVLRQLKHVYMCEINLLILFLSLYQNIIYNSLHVKKYEKIWVQYFDEIKFYIFYARSDGIREVQIYKWIYNKY